MNNRNILSKTYIHAIIHILVWLFIIFFPLLFIIYDDEKAWFKHINFMIPMLFASMLFYANYMFLIPKYLFNKKLLIFFALNLLLVVFFMIVANQLQDIVTIMDFYKRPDGFIPKPPRFFIVSRNFIPLLLSIGISVAIKMTNILYKTEQKRKELEKLHVESELSMLKNQLNPHFLFNTLNNIYSLISINQSSAQQALHQLSKLLRYVLYESNKEWVSIKHEIEMLNDYIALMSLRLNKEVFVDSKFEIKEDIQIAPLLFISLIENAFKHGVHPTQKSFIKIYLGFMDNLLFFTITNSNFPKDNSDKSGSGIGLDNLKKRLEIIYPNKHTFQIHQNQEIYSVELTLSI